MIQDILKEFDKKFTVKFNGKRILFYDFEKDKDLISPENIKQFIEEEIKKAREETIMEVESKISKIPKIEMTFSDIKDILNKLKKYETIRTI